MAICEFCKTEMTAQGNGCNLNALRLEDGWVIDRFPIELDGNACPDCNASKGYHHPGCDNVRCPLCGGQESFCDCPIESYIIWREICIK